MELNDSNFNLQTKFNKYDSEAKIAADSRVQELQSELKFKVGEYTEIK
jgi:hypothetical protein